MRLPIESLHMSKRVSTQWVLRQSPEHQIRALHGLPVGQLWIGQRSGKDDVSLAFEEVFDWGRGCMMPTSYARSQITWSRCPVSRACRHAPEPKCVYSIAKKCLFKTDKWQVTYTNDNACLIIHTTYVPLRSITPRESLKQVGRHRALRVGSNGESWLAPVNFEESMHPRNIMQKCTLGPTVSAGFARWYV